MQNFTVKGQVAHLTRIIHLKTQSGGSQSSQKLAPSFWFVSPNVDKSPHDPTREHLYFELALIFSWNVF